MSYFCSIRNQKKKNEFERILSAGNSSQSGAINLMCVDPCGSRRGGWKVWGAWSDDWPKKKCEYSREIGASDSGSGWKGTRPRSAFPVSRNCRRLMGLASAETFFLRSPWKLRFKIQLRFYFLKRRCPQIRCPRRNPFFADVLDLLKKNRFLEECQAFFYDLHSYVRLKVRPSFPGLFTFFKLR